MNSKYVELPIIIIIFFETSATAGERQKLIQENSSLKADIAIMEEAAANYTIQIKSLNSKLNILLMDYCERTSKYAPQLPSSCAVALKNGGQSGVYKLNIPDSGLKPFDVYCQRDPNLGPAWTIFQRRQDGSVDFYRGWQDYKHGFGNISGEHFLGLDKLHAITTKVQLQELWIHLADFVGATFSVEYEAFAIGDEDTKYSMTILGDFLGTSGNSMHVHRGQKFTTKDSDNDNIPLNCAVQFSGAWWYDSCYNSNLNGLYGADKGEKGIVWLPWWKIYNLKYTHMAVRPVH